MDKLSRKFLGALAVIFRVLNLPHFLKYGLFLVLKKKQIPVRSLIKVSNAKIDLNLGDFIDYWIFMDGSYENDWQVAVRNLVKRKVFIDVGSNIGIYPLTLYKDARYIYAFEPEEKNFIRLKNNIKLNAIENVKAIKRAIFSRDFKSISLYLNKDDQGWHSLSIPYTGGIQKVQSTTLDHFIKKNKIRDIGLIKIDVEEQS